MPRLHDRFLVKINAITAWSALWQEIILFYTKAEGVDRPIGLARILRTYAPQQRLGLSDDGNEDGSQAFRNIVGVNLNREPVLDATMLLRCGRLLETHDLTCKLFETIKAHLTAKDLLMREGTIIDSAPISAPASTKTRDKAHDLEIHWSKKGNDCHFGMKAYIGVDSPSGIEYTPDAYKWLSATTETTQEKREQHEPPT